MVERDGETATGAAVIRLKVLHRLQWRLTNKSHTTKRFSCGTTSPTDALIYLLISNSQIYQSPTNTCTLLGFPSL